MKRVSIAFLFLLVIVISATAQNAPSVKVASIDTDRFYDQKVGIRIFTNAIDIVVGGDTGLAFARPALLKKISELEKEIQTLACQGKPTFEVLEKLNQTKAHLKEMEEADRIQQKRQDAILIEPIRKQIREKLFEYSKQNGFEIVVEKSSLVSGSLIEQSDSIPDITTDFIKFFNSWHDQKNQKVTKP